MQRESQVHQALQDFIRDIGAPFHIHRDNYKIKMGKIWTGLMRNDSINGTATEPFYHNKMLVMISAGHEEGS